MTAPKPETVAVRRAVAAVAPTVLRSSTRPGMPFPRVGTIYDLVIGGVTCTYRVNRADGPDWTAVRVDPPT